MAIPDRVLYKPGPLDDSERAIMRQHPLLAMRMLAGIPYLRSALVIPIAHHEYWDGSGYPEGLRGDAIPLAARIFTVVDHWDALRSDRPYRKAWDAPQTIAYLRDRGDMAIVLVEQYFEFARDLADRFAVMDRGAVVLSGTKGDMVEQEVRAHLSV